ncbi:MAG: cobalamin-binding protein [Firmicutes bacterium]|nr:cobalamin-binding protein [Bacillota bacterium]
MKTYRRRLIPSLLLLSLLVTLLVGCTRNVEPEEPGEIYPLTLVDSFDREVTVEKEPEVIVSLAPSATEILFALGLGDKVKGVSDVCNYPEEVLAIEKMGGYMGVDVERVVSVQPDLVIADSQTTKEVVEQLEGFGIAVLALKADDIEGMFSHIELIGEATNAKEEAEQLVQELQDRLQVVADKTKSLERPAVFYEVWHEPLMSAGKNTFINSVIEAAGGENVMVDAATDWPEVDLELLISKEPAVIILGHDGQSVDEAKARANWQTMPAAKEGRIYAVNPDIFNRPGPRLVDAVEELARLLHPGLFE